MSSDPTKQATLYRMVMDKHVCPFGLKSLDLLKREGYEVEDKWLTSREQTDAFKEQHDVETTPQTFINETRIGGYDALRQHFGKKVKAKDETSYQPVLAVFGVAALLALAISWMLGEGLLSIRTAELFIAISMSILALLKLQDVESFSTMFLNYDLLARRVVPYSYVYPFGRSNAVVGYPCRIIYRHGRRGISAQGSVYRQTRTQMRLRRWWQQCTTGICIAHRKPDDDRDGAVDVQILLGQ